MNRSEFAILVILRVIGVSALFAIPFIFVPFAWMDSIHNFLGLGDLPDTPIVSYLTRSLSAFYAIVGCFTLMISMDVRRYRSFVKLSAWLGIVTGVVLLGVDLHAGLPISWTLSEGPPTTGVGLVLLWLERNINDASSE